VAGKWRQLSHFSSKEDGTKWGFDEFLIWGAGAPEDGSTASRAEKKAKRAGEGNTKGERYWNPEYNLNGRTMQHIESKYGPDLLHAFVVDFIQRHKSQPFFVYYPMPLIHGANNPARQKHGKEGNNPPSWPPMRAKVHITSITSPILISWLANWWQSWML
jgi:hypothetical protein